MKPTLIRSGEARCRALRLRLITAENNAETAHRWELELKNIPGMATATQPRRLYTFSPLAATAENLICSSLAKVLALHPALWRSRMAVGLLKLDIQAL